MHNTRNLKLDGLRQQTFFNSILWHKIIVLYEQMSRAVLLHHFNLPLKDLHTNTNLKSQLTVILNTIHPYR